MKFTVRKQDLQQELGLVLGVVEARATIPILSHLLFRADKEGLQLLATDLETGLRSSCAADVNDPGAVAVPAKKLHDVVRSLSCDVISFESDGSHWLNVEGGAYRGRIAGLPDSDFPTTPEAPQGGPTLSIPLTAFQQMIQRIIFAVTTENTRFSINGALLLADKESLTLVATDGHRLGRVHRTWEQPDLESAITVLTPRKALLELGKLPVEDENSEVELSAAGNYVFFRTPRRLLFSRTLEGTFPSYEKVIPTENPVYVTADRKELLNVIARVALLTSDSSPLITLEFSGGTMTAVARNPSLGEATETLAVEQSGDEVRVGLNHEYVQQFLSVLSTERVGLRLKDSATQALFVPEGETDAAGYEYVVMPMRLT